MKEENILQQLQVSISCAQAQQNSLERELHYLSTLPNISQKVLSAKLQQVARAKQLTEDLYNLIDPLKQKLTNNQKVIDNLQNACAVSGMRLIEVASKPNEKRLTIAEIACVINDTDPTATKIATKPRFTLQTLKDLANSNLIIT